MEVLSYLLPAGIYSDVSDSYKPQKKEANLAKVIKINSKTLRNNSICQKSLKGRTMGLNFVNSLMDRGQDPVISHIISYLNWYEVALLLLSITNPDNLMKLLCLVAIQGHTIMTINSDMRNNQGKKFIF